MLGMKDVVDCMGVIWLFYTTKHDWWHCVTSNPHGQFDSLKGRLKELDW